MPILGLQNSKKKKKEKKKKPRDTKRLINIPGPAGELLKLLDRHLWRPGHIHLLVCGHVGNGFGHPMNRALKHFRAEI